MRGRGGTAAGYKAKRGGKSMRQLSGERLQRERERLLQMRVYERAYQSFGAVCGVDEAGRGPLAGPVAAAAVILPEGCEILYLNDSKKLSPARRELLFDEIREKAVGCAVGIVSPERIDEINILQATYEAMRAAIRELKRQPDVLLNDAVTIPGMAIHQVPIIKGDAKSVSIAAASVLAKVTRDRMMTEYDKLYPEYGFAQHKGYGTAQHIAVLREFGPCPIHRRSFIGRYDKEDQRGLRCSGGERMPDTEKRNRRQLGALYEQKAEEYLKAQGVTILQRNYRTRSGEIDLIGQDGAYLVFFEVKYRSGTDFGAPFAAIDWRKRRKITDTARHYLYAQHYGADTPVRFDCIGITPQELSWEKNAFYA